MSRELDALVAEKVLGWSWWERPDDDTGKMRKALFPPQEDRRVNFFPSFRPAQPNTERFSDWYRTSINVGYKGIERFGLPEWSTDIATAMTLVTVNHGLSLERLTVHGVWQWICYLAVDEKWGESSTALENQADTAPLAICFAALREKGVPESEILAALNTKGGA